jgi:hypothetical protein
MNGTAAVRVRESFAHEITVRFDVDLNGNTYDVSVSACDREGYDVEVWNSNGDTVDTGDFIGRLGYTSLHLFGDAMLDGFYLDGPSKFDLFVKQGAAQ